MVICCIPKCSSDSNTCHSLISFHDFPTNPDAAAKWITQINSFVDNGRMWFPRRESVVCSKHFTPSDFKPDSNVLKPRCVPSIFNCPRTFSSPLTSINKRKNEFTSSPLIVKVLKPSDKLTDCSDIAVSEIASSPCVQECDENESIITSSSSNNQITSSTQKETNEDNLPSPAIQNVFSIKTLKEQVAKALNSMPPSNSKVSQDESCQSSNSQNLLFSSNMCTYEAKAKQTADVVQKSNPDLNRRMQKKVFSPTKRAQKVSSDLIEIGPNTFLKINPDIIRVNKKQTPSGNTVLQFIMNQRMAMSHADEILPKLMQTVPKSASQGMREADSQNSPVKKLSTQSEVQHVLGHMVDTHVCKDSCSKLRKTQDDLETCAENENLSVFKDKSFEFKGKGETERQFSKRIEDSPEDPLDEKNLDLNDDSACMAKAPILLTTNVPFSHYFTDKSKYSSLLRQKSRQIASLNLKISKLTQKVEELEDKCIVQERQLSYSFIKRIKTIRKYASKGDPAATYILEQIRGFAGKTRTLTRWSDTTLTQCAIWCRKAPYAYEYFKKAKFFNLPALGTVKRYIKTHPEIKFVNKPNTNNINTEIDDSSSDFDFDETDSDVSGKEEGNVPCETILSIPSEEASAVNQDLVTNSDPSQLPGDMVTANGNLSQENAEIITSDINNVSENHQPMSDQHVSVTVSNGEIPIEIDRSNLEIQELILPSGEVVQCISSAMCNGQDGNQYYIIPTVNEQNTGDHQYSIVQSDSIILQNIENPEISSEQQELIFITNSGEPVECSQTEIASA